MRTLSRIRGLFGSTKAKSSDLEGESEFAREMVYEGLITSVHRVSQSKSLNADDRVDLISALLDTATELQKGKALRALSSAFRSEVMDKIRL